MISIHGIDTLIVGSWVKVTLRTQTSLLSEMMQSFNKGNNKITELRTILQRESQNS